MTCLWFKIQYQTISEMNVLGISQKRQREANRKIISSTTYDDHPGRTCGRKDSVRFPTRDNMNNDNSRINKQNVNNSLQSPQKDAFKKSEMYMKHETFSERNQTQRSPVQSIPMVSTSPPRPKITTVSEIPASSLKSNISRVPNVEETRSQNSPTEAYTRCGKVKLPSTLPPGNKTIIVKTCSRTKLKEHNELTVNYSISEQIKKQPFQNADKEKLWQIEDKGLNSAGSMMKEGSKSKSIDTGKLQLKDERDKEENTSKFSISSKVSTASKQTMSPKLSLSSIKSKSLTKEEQHSSFMKSPVAEKTPDKEPSSHSQSIRSIMEIITVSSRSVQTNDSSEDSSSSEGSSACSNDTSTTTEKKKKKKCCLCF